ncbi:MAG TPA: O-antigen ligase family protein [Patescibacteria group bacterium]|nr:O-antigen ligase family protein [Patescibacteria group bacterium]
MGKSVKASKHRTSYNKPLIDEKLANVINYTFIFLISIFLIIIPFYRGLYFRENYIPAFIYMSGIFVLYILYKLAKKEYNILNSYLDIAVLLLPVVYLVSFFFSVNAKDAFDAVLKYAAYFMIYKIAVDLSRNSVYKKILEYAVITAMFVMAAVGLMAALGYLDLNGVILYKRIYGLYQYSNATASALGAAIFLAVGFSLNKGKIYEKAYNNLVLATVFPAFVLAFSRGAYIIFAALALLNIIILNARKRVQFIYSMLILVASNGMFLLKYYGSENVKDSLIYLAGGIIIFLALQLLYEKLLSKPIEKISTKAVNVVLLSLFAVSVVAVVTLFSIKTPMEYKVEHTAGEAESWKSKVLQINEITPDREYTVQFQAKSDVKSESAYRIVIQSVSADGERSSLLDKKGTVGNEFMQIDNKFSINPDTQDIRVILYNYEENSYTVYNDVRVLDSKGNIIKRFDKFKYIPEALAERFADISLQTQSVSTRAYYLKDGIKIIKDNFLIGTGGGGWKNLYRQYQSQAYDSTEAHNFYLQYMIETGIIGVIVLLTVYYLFMRKAFISLFKEKDYTQLPLCFALIMMMGHAFMDFDLSLTALAFLFWMMIGIAGTKGKEGEAKQINNSFTSIGLLICAALVLYFSSSIYTAMLQGREAASLIDKDTNKSISLYESAMARDPFNSNYHMDYIQVMYRSYKSSNDAVSLQKMQKSMDKVLDLGLNDTRQSSVLVNLLLSTGRLDKTIEVVDDMVDRNPMIAEMYMYKLNVNYEIAKQFFTNNQQDRAIPYLKNMIEVETQFNENNEKAAKPMRVPEKMEEIIKLAKDWLGTAEKK